MRILKTVIILLFICWLILTIILIAQLNELDKKEKQIRKEIRQIKAKNSSLECEINRTICNRKCNR